MDQNPQINGVEPREKSVRERPPALARDPAPVAGQEFRAALSKKLRTPLNDIMGFAQLLATQAGTTGHDDSAQQILAAAKRLLEIINEELDGGRAQRKSDRPPSAPSAPFTEVLYIEDEPANVILVERTLHRRPALRLLHAGTGEEGLDLARSQLPRLILLDLNLPGIDGAEVLRRLQQEPVTANIPVVIISADATASQIERLLTAGARD